MTTPDRPQPVHGADGESGADEAVRRLAEKVPQLSKLKPDEREQAIRDLVSVEIGFSGPLPPPAILERYNAIIPNGADRLLSLVEADLSHSHAMQREGLALQHAMELRQHGALRYEQTYRLSGQICGLLACLAAFGLAAFVAWLGSPLAGTLFGSVTLGGIVATFVYGRRAQSDGPQRTSAGSKPSAKPSRK